jgi:hypothetical protein
MKTKLILPFISLLLFSCSHLVTATTKSSSSENPHLISEITEGVFRVKSDKIIIKEGTEQDCLQARQLVSYALENRAVNISGMEYTVELKKLITSFKATGTDDLLMIYQYIVDIDSRKENPSLAQFLMNLKSQDYITDLVSQYKAPITCHYFIKKEKLIFLTYYGLFPAYEGFNPKKFIKFIKK